MTDYLEANLDENTYWRFMIDSTAKTCNHQSEEVFQHLERLFDAFNDFIIPTEMSVNCRLMTENLGISDCLSQAKSAPFKSHTFEVEQCDNTTHIEEDIDNSHNNSLYIPLFQIDQHKVKVELDSGTHYLDLESPRYRYPEQFTSSQENPLYEPVKPWSFFHSDWERGVEKGHPFSYTFRVSVHSDIWFQETDLGRRNRKNLAKFLQDVETNLPVFSVERKAGYQSIEKLEQIY